MGKSQRDKGNRTERAIVNYWRGLGLKASRVPLSGGAGGDYGGDIDLYAFGESEAPLIGESKARGAGFKTLYTWLANKPEPDFLVLKADNAERLYVLPERVMRDLVMRKRG